MAQSVRRSTSGDTAAIAYPQAGTADPYGVIAERALARPHHGCFAAESPRSLWGASERGLSFPAGEYWGRLSLSTAPGACPVLPRAGDNGVERIAVYAPCQVRRLLRLVGSEGIVAEMTGCMLPCLEAVGRDQMTNFPDTAARYDVRAVLRLA